MVCSHITYTRWWPPILNDQLLAVWYNSHYFLIRVKIHFSGTFNVYHVCHQTLSSKTTNQSQSADILKLSFYHKCWLQPILDNLLHLLVWYKIHRLAPFAIFREKNQMLKHHPISFSPFKAKIFSCNFFGFIQTCCAVKRYARVISAQMWADAAKVTHPSPA